MPTPTTLNPSDAGANLTFDGTDLIVTNPPFVNQWAGFAFDADAMQIWIYNPITGLWNNNSSAHPDTGAGGLDISSITGPYYAAATIYLSDDIVALNFGATTFNQAAPSGFSAYGAGVTLDPAYISPSHLIMSPDNLSISGGNGSWYSSRATTSVATGKVYWEATALGLSASLGVMAGICNASQSMATYVGNGANSGSVRSDGETYSAFAGVAPGAWAPWAGAPTVMAFCLDADAKKLWMSRYDGAYWNNSGTPDPATGTSGYDISSLGSTFYAMVSLYTTADSETVNFGGSPFARAVPAGYSAWGAGTTLTGSGGVTLTNGDLTATGTTGGTWNSVKSSTGIGTGKVYWEITIQGSVADNGVLLGLCNASESMSNYAGATGNSGGAQCQGSSYGAMAGLGWGSYAPNMATYPHTGRFPQSVRATTGKSSGQFVFEYTPGTLGATRIGMTTGSFDLTQSLGYDDNGIGAFLDGNAMYLNGANVGYTNAPQGNTTMFAIDLNAKKFLIYNPSIPGWEGSSSGTPGVSGGADLTALGVGDLYPTVNMNSPGSMGTINFAGPFVNTVPAGFFAWDYIPVPGTTAGVGPQTGEYRTLDEVGDPPFNMNVAMRRVTPSSAYIDPELASYVIDPTNAIRLQRRAMTPLDGEEPRSLVLRVRRFVSDDAYWDSAPKPTHPATVPRRLAFAVTLDEEERDAAARIQSAMRRYMPPSSYYYRGQPSTDMSAAWRHMSALFEADEEATAELLMVRRRAIIGSASVTLGISSYFPMIFMA